MRILLVLVIAFLAVFTGSVSAAKVKCEMCEYVIHTTTDLINQNFTQAEIIHNLENACNFLPSKFAPTCQTVVDLYTPTIIQKILDKETAPVICAQIHLCPKANQEEHNGKHNKDHHNKDHHNKDHHNKDHHNKDHHKKDHHKKDHHKKDQKAEEQEKAPMLGFHWKHHHGHNPLKKLECKACDYAVKHAEKHILSGQSTADVEKYVDQECNNFEIHEAVHICKKIIHESVNKIVEEIKKHETPEHVCKNTLHMC